MHIGIYDTQHFETTYTLIRICDKPGNKITLFVTSEVALPLYEMLGKDAQRFQWIIKNSNNATYIQKIYSYCKKNKVALLWLNTVTYHHLFFALLCLLLAKTMTILTIHDANGFFNPKLLISIRSMVRFLGKKALAKSITAYSVLLSSTKEFIEANFHPEQEVYVVPGSIYENDEQQKGRNHEIMKLVIPGSIDNRRRNYNDVLELQNLLQKSSQKWEFVLLGTAQGVYGAAIINKCKTIINTNAKITFYETVFVPSSEYEQQLKTADFIFLPLKQFAAIEDGIPEEYGVTKSTGSFFDAVRYGKLILLPQNINIPEELKEQCIIYSSLQELVQILKSYRKENDSEYNNRLQAAQKNALHFTLEQVRLSLTFL